MSSQPVRIVFDCMIYAQAMVSPSGPASACVELVRSGDLKLIWSDYVLQEIRELPAKLPARMKLTPERVETFLSALARFVEYAANVPVLFENPFDHDDSHYVNLALESNASLIATRDRDLLRLVDDSYAEARDFRKRFPNLGILPPEQVMKLLLANRP